MTTPGPAAVLQGWRTTATWCCLTPMTGIVICLSASKLEIIPSPPLLSLYSVLSSLNGGWLTVFETREEWACVEHYVSQAYSPSSQRYAISLRSDFGSEGIYKWIYADGSEAFPEFEVWAPGHPRNDPCVSMEVDGGQWIDGDCYENQGISAICEKAPPTTTTTSPPTTTTDEETPTDSGPDEWTDVCNYEDNFGDTCCSSGMQSKVI